MPSAGSEEPSGGEEPNGGRGAQWGARSPVGGEEPSARSESTRRRHSFTILWPLAGMHRRRITRSRKPEPRGASLPIQRLLPSAILWPTAGTRRPRVTRSRKRQAQGAQLPIQHLFSFRDLVVYREKVPPQGHKIAQARGAMHAPRASPSTRSCDLPGGRADAKPQDRVEGGSRGSSEGEARELEKPGGSSEGAHYHGQAATTDSRTAKT